MVRQYINLRLIMVITALCGRLEAKGEKPCYIRIDEGPDVCQCAVAQTVDRIYILDDACDRIIEIDRTELEIVRLIDVQSKSDVSMQDLVMRGDTLFVAEYGKMIGMYDKSLKHIGDVCSFVGEKCFIVKNDQLIVCDIETGEKFEINHGLVKGLEVIEDRSVLLQAHGYEFDLIKEQNRIMFRDKGMYNIDSEFFEVYDEYISFPFDYRDSKLVYFYNMDGILVVVDTDGKVERRCTILCEMKTN